MRRLGLSVAALAVLACGCGGSSRPPSAAVVARAAPDLAGFLKLPVATPSVCPSTVNGSTVGRRSPWVGHVDVSVFLSPSVTTRQTLKLGNELRTDRLVQRVYFESSRQAFEEFERLYTCSSEVPRSQTPASYRLILVPTASIATRDLLVAHLTKHADVDSVSCDPSLPCVNIVRSPGPTPTSSPTR